MPLALSLFCICLCSSCGNTEQSEPGKKNTSEQNATSAKAEPNKNWPEMITVWREAEEFGGGNWANIAWKPKESAEDSAFFSGTGGAYSALPARWKWQFRITDEVRQDNLMPRRRHYWVWLRVYGYRHQPGCTVFLDQRQIANFTVNKTEQTDKKGEYVGGGGFYWQQAGRFFETGGGHMLEIAHDKGAMWLDAVLITTDRDFTPEKFESRDGASRDFFTDIRAHQINPLYHHNGVCRDFPTPIAFSLYPLDGKAFPVQPEDSAKAYLELPAGIRVTSATSHFAGVNRKSTRIQPDKDFYWKQTASFRNGGERWSRYEFTLAYMGLTLAVFAQSDRSLKPGRNVQGKCWLEFNDTKQAPQAVSIDIVNMPKTKAFRKLLIGPCGGNGMMYTTEYQGIWQAFAQTGMNFYNPWHFPTESAEEECGKFMREAATLGVKVVGEISPFVGMWAPSAKSESGFAVDSQGGKTHAVSLVPDGENMLRNTESIRERVRAGTSGIVFDDEGYNQQGDRLDYSPHVKQAFREWLGMHTKLVYQDPLEIVKNKATEKALYDAWVEFKCDCLVQRYKTFRQAFDEEWATKGQTDPLFIAQILINKTPEESRTNTYWDYRKLAGVCTQISPMIYTYQGIRDSAKVGDVVKIYADYCGRNAIAPTLLAGHGGFGEVAPTDKAMIRYQIYEALIHQAPGVYFWVADGVLNAVNLREIAEAVRVLQPHEDLLLTGKPYDKFTTDCDRVRILQSGAELLVYAADYRGETTPARKIGFPELKVNSVRDAATGKAVVVVANGFTFDLVPDRGRLFVVKTAAP
jgi:hypothetical protein